MSTQDKVIAIIAQQALLEPSDITSNSVLAELGIDSSGLVECIFAIEEEFDVSIPFNANLQDQPDFDTSNVAEIVSGIDRLIAAKD